MSKGWWRADGRSRTGTVEFRRMDWWIRYGSPGLHSSRARIPLIWYPRTIHRVLPISMHCAQSFSIMRMRQCLFEMPALWRQSDIAVYMVCLRWRPAWSCRSVLRKRWLRSLCPQSSWHRWRLPSRGVWWIRWASVRRGVHLELLRV